MSDSPETRPIPGYEGRYSVSERGQVWSYLSGKWLKAHPTNLGYMRVVLYNEETQAKSIEVHVLVLEAFVGPRPRGLLGLHRDDNGHNNWLDNLYWGTFQDQETDRVRNGGRVRGETNGNAKLTGLDVLDMRKRHLEGESVQGIADLFGVSWRAARNAITGQTWSHI